jgi:DNA-binding CsgD family transcriptional regulator
MTDLTASQLAVLRLIADGHPDHAIATRLRLSQHTIKNRRGNIFRTLGAHNAAEAVAIGYRRGLLAIDPDIIIAAGVLRQATELGYNLALSPRSDT